MKDLIDGLLNASAPFLKMQKSLTERRWGTALAALAASPDLAPFSGLLASLATQGFGRFESLNAFLQTEAPKIDAMNCGRAMLFIEEHAIAANPYSALVAATVVLKSWSVWMGDGLYAQQGGMPSQGWTFFPLVCARAALKAGAVDSAVKIVNRAIDVLNAARYRYLEGWKAGMAEYRALAKDAEARFRMAVENLASDLQTSCGKEDPSFRSEFAAILWTLGMVPEALVVRDAGEVLPLRLCRQVVRLSIAMIPTDPLLQYIWLEMKDRPPFNLRDHTAFFGLINLKYSTPGFMLDEMMPEAPSAVYAKTLIAWMKGILTEELAGQFVQYYQVVSSMFPECDWTVYIRMNMLAWIVSRQFRRLKRDDVEAERQWLEDLVAKASSVNRNTQANPTWPQLYTKTSGPVFMLMDNLSRRTGDDGRLPALESFRAANLVYPLLVSPPRPSAQEAAAAAEWIQKESEMLADLKGCYFLLLNPVLPPHYRHFDVDLRDPSLMNNEQLKAAPETFRKLKQQLAELYESMKAQAPGYAGRRLEPAANLSRVGEALRAHRSPHLT